MSRTFDCSDDTQREDGLRTAAAAIGRGGLVVLPTDTLYGVGADAFNPGAVASLLAAKGRDRSMPPPVLIAGRDVLSGLATDLSEEILALAEAFWPGGLTIICRAQPSLAWDLGDTAGTVAVRVPDHPVALDLLRTCGPLAVSSANLSGRPPVATAAQAQGQLGTDVEVYLEAGPLRATVASTIVDATGPRLTVVRDGAVSLEQLRDVVPGVVGKDGDTPAPGGGESAARRPSDSEKLATAKQPSDGAGPGESGPVKSGSAKSGADESQPVESGSVESGPGESGPAHSGSADSGTVESGPAKSGSAKSGSVDSEPVRPASSTTSPSESTTATQETYDARRAFSQRHPEPLVASSYDARRAFAEREARRAEVGTDEPPEGGRGAGAGGP